MYGLFHGSDNMLTWEKWGKRRVGMRKQLIKKKRKNMHCLCSISLVSWTTIFLCFQGLDSGSRVLENWTSHPYTRIIASLWLKKWLQEKDARRNSFKWPGAVGGLQGELQCGSPVKTLQDRLGEYIFWL